jgi:hypothetical protein
MTDRREDLLVARLDGELTPDQGAEIERLLAGDESARQRAGELQALVDALNLLGPVDPPARVMRAVVDHLSQVAPATGAVHESQTSSIGGVLMRTKVLWGMAAAAAIILGIFAVKGFPPDMSGTEGAIGAAKRYQAGQIEASDVKLGDQTAQEFLQSDLFDKLMKDDAVRKALSDPALGKALADPALGKALTNADFLTALTNADFRAALTNADFRTALADQAMGRALADNGLGKALADPAVSRALSDPAVRLALSNSSLSKALTDPALGAALKSADLQQALKFNGLSAALRSPQFGEALRTQTNLR